MSTQPLVLTFALYTDSHCNLDRQSIPEFVHDPRFHVHGVAIRHPDGACRFTPDAAAAVADLRARYGADLEQVTVLVHDGLLHGYILAHRFDLRPRQMVDTYQLACAVIGRRSGGSLSLDDLAQRFGRQPRVRPSLVGVRRPTVQQATGVAKAACDDAHLIYDLTLQLGARFPWAAVEERVAQHTLRLHNERGFTVDVAAIDGVRRAIQAEVDQWSAQAQVTPAQAAASTGFVGLLRQALHRTGRVLPVKTGAKGLIPATAKQDPEMLAMLDDDDPVVAALAHAHLAKGSSQQLLARLDKLERIATATGGILPVHLVYHGAHTGRFAGGGGWSVQNLPKKGVGARIRGLLRAPAGSKLVSMDLSQIEVRVLAEVAGEAFLLRAFRENRDIYCDEATTLFGQPVFVPGADVAPAEADRLDAMRQTGKQMVLGLGYQMAWVRFLNALRMDPKCARLFTQGLLTEQKCEEIVTYYRKKYTPIPALWWDLQRAVTSAMESGTTKRVRRLVVSRDGADVVIRLPSGRTIRYADLRKAAGSRDAADAGGDPPARGGLLYGPGEGTHLYGGKITENVIQAISRDVLVEALLRLEARGVQVLCHVHDDVVALAPTEQADAHLQILYEELTRAPAWLPNVLLAAKGGVRETYAKC